jgi:hypothetical protein
MPRRPHVSFGEEGSIRNRKSHLSEPGGLIGLIMRVSGGKITSPTQANIVLIAIPVVLFVLLFIVLRGAEPVPPDTTLIIDPRESLGP